MSITHVCQQYKKPSYKSIISVLLEGLKSETRLDVRYHYHCITTKLGSVIMEDESAKIKEQLLELAKLPPNTSCADCGEKDPQWASANLGIFICIVCAGMVIHHLYLFFKKI